MCSNELNGIELDSGFYEKGVGEKRKRRKFLGILNWYWRKNAMV